MRNNNPGAEGGIMVSGKAVIRNREGLHLKPAARFAREAMKFSSTVTFTVRDVTANAKSILSVLSACVRNGEEIEIVCSGEDEEEALKQLRLAVYEGLGDEKE